MNTFLCVLFFSVCLAGCDLFLVRSDSDDTPNKNTPGDLTLDQRYPKSLKAPSKLQSAEIARTLISNKIAVCEEFSVRPSSQDVDEYLVCCSSGGVPCTYYMVFVYTNRVMGPFTESMINPSGR